MRWLINYFRQAFCRHEFEDIGKVDVYENGEDTPYKIIRTYRCRKCGYVQRVRI